MLSRQEKCVLLPLFRKELILTVSIYSIEDNCKISNNFLVEDGGCGLFPSLTILRMKSILKLWLLILIRKIY